ncbi:DegT/DnrJ/EryC1/StrS family aminotransferase [Kiloniella sp.]|uniref:DegT/DnrJ/EryC1/StrS family aminotransferase n=1 Tax=Kiloniella sp. TaxID=1938587 RepID=UPI003A9299D2
MIPLTKPDIHFDEVAEDIRAILDSGWLTNGRYVRLFEEIFAEYVGVDYAISTTSATTALHLALEASGVGSDDEVLVSDFTFPASGNSIVQAGAKPVLVDCEPGKFTFSVDDAVKKITTKTKAIMPVDPFGQPANMKAICCLAEEYGLVVIEDAACAVGAEGDGKRSGAWPGVGCFSFHPRKVITTGEGGMITTDDAGIAERARRLRSHGGNPGVTGMTFVKNGYNYRMSEIQAALGLAQMKKLDFMLEKRRHISAAYSKQLSEIGGVSFPLDSEGRMGTFQSYVVLLDDDVDRDELVVRLRGEGIETTLGTYAMHAQAAFSRFGYIVGDLPNSLRAQNQSLSLPIYTEMTDEDIAAVADCVAIAIRELR